MIICTVWASVIAIKYSEDHMSDVIKDYSRLKETGESNFMALVVI